MDAPLHSLHSIDFKKENPMPKIVTLLVLSLFLSSCTGMNDTQQRMVSGAAIGGTIAGPIGAAIGGGIGWMVDVGDNSKRERDSSKF